MTFRPPKSPHQHFMTLTLQRYRAMVVRFAERKDKRDRVYRYAKQIPFTLEQFREWILKQLGGSEEGTCRCAYCGRPLDIGTLVIDHGMPPDRGGSLGFDNLVASCDDDNMRKGRMSMNGYMYLLKCAEQLNESDRRDLLSRLQSSLKNATLNRRNMAREAKAKAEAAVANG